MATTNVNLHALGGAVKMITIHVIDNPISSLASGFYLCFFTYCTIGPEPDTASAVHNALLSKVISETEES